MFSKILPFNASLRRRIVKLVFFCLVLILVVLTSSWRLLDSYENILLDLRFFLRPVQNFSDKIILIEISDDTLKSLGYWPLPRDFHASLVDVLSALGTKQVMFDVIFTDPTQEDDAFSASVKDAGNVYLPYVLRIESDLQSKKLPKAKGMAASILPKLADAAKATGYINSYRDADGKNRWVPLFIDFNGELKPHISLRMACDYLGIPLENIVFHWNAVSIGPRLTIPTSSSGAMLVNYAGRWRQTFKHYSYVDVLGAWQDRAAKKAPRVPLDDFKGAVCFVGMTATGTSDLQAIPLEKEYPMVGLHANIFSSILLDRYVYRVSAKTNLIILFILLGIVFLTTSRKRNQPIAAFSYTVGYSFLFVSFAFGIFMTRGIWIDVFCPFIMMIFMNTGVSIYNFLEENRKHELVEKELSIAKSIQDSFLPSPIERFGSLEIATSMVTAKHVGGDLYDMYALGKYRMGVFIGDVSGKGVPAALVMAKAISLFRMLAGICDEPSDLLFQLNEEMVRNTNPGIFVTATYVIYIVPEHKILVANAGHCPTLILRKKDHTVEKIQPKEGLPLGLVNSVEFSQGEAVLDPGDTVILYTDGVVEAKNLRREDFGEERLFSVMRACENDSASQLIREVTKEISSFIGRAPQHDDCTLIVLKEHGIETF
ncbi:MAG TPA: CHASE2 domain-containing protein [Candidatus Omnitrophota bacterium]|nr:CHASE2 domain-containing protein [Candidatus Omnitrophota bacterium]HPD85542.1 CHASE2 domain-containing protein [Candidatus Omnitrophota bacterium]HRZ04418.1 CHASE2 domain-containing protein [Candidatus Omnitrophota bacterium]